MSYRTPHEALQQTAPTLSWPEYKWHTPLPLHGPESHYCDKHVMLINAANLIAEGFDYLKEIYYFYSCNCDIYYILF